RIAIVFADARQAREQRLPRQLVRTAPNVVDDAAQQTTENRSLHLLAFVDRAPTARRVVRQKANDAATAEDRRNGVPAVTHDARFATNLHDQGHVREDDPASYAAQDLRLGLAMMEALVEVDVMLVGRLTGKTSAPRAAQVLATFVVNEDRRALEADAIA